MLLLLAFPRTGFAEKNAVICKENVGNSWATSTNKNVCQKLVLGCLMDECREPLNTNEEKSWGERVPLPKPSCRRDVPTSSPVYNN